MAGLFSTVYESSQTSRWQDHGTISDSAFLSGSLIVSFSGIFLSSSSQPVIKSTMSFSVSEAFDGTV